MQVEKWNAEAEGPPTEDLLREKLEAMGYELTRYVYPPGTIFDTHTHSIEKVDAVISGTFRIVMGRKSVVLKAGDIVIIPAGAEHSAEVLGDKPVVSLDGVQVFSGS